MIDLSRLPVPAVIEPLSHEQLFQGFVTKFLEEWAYARALDPTLPQYDVEPLETDPVVIVGQALSYLRLLDRQRVNDAIKALLAPLSTGTNLDNVVARQGVQRLVVIPATSTSAAVMESDESLLKRYFDSFERFSAGSAARYLYEARTAWPQSQGRTQGLWDARVNGHAVHGRRGDTDIVIAGPFGREATQEELATVRAAVTAPWVQPEAVAVTVVNAKRHEYSVHLTLEVPRGPDPELIRNEAVARVERAAEARAIIGGELPPAYLAGAAYGPSIIRVHDAASVVFDADLYTIPVMTGLTVNVEVRA